MGYYTSYSLKVDATPGILDKVNAELKNNDHACYALMLGDYCGDDEYGSAEACKWYEHERDMRDLSAKFPSVLFTLHGEGEESGDIWTKYFMDGKMQAEKAKIVVAPFDKRKLT